MAPQINPRALAMRAHTETKEGTMPNFTIGQALSWPARNRVGFYQGQTPSWVLLRTLDGELHEVPTDQIEEM